MEVWEVLKTVKGKNVLIYKNRFFWQRLRVNICFISVSSVPRFQGISNSEDSLVSYSGIIEVNGVIITTSVSCNIWASFTFFLHVEWVLFSSLENTFRSHQCSSKDNRRKKFYNNNNNNNNNNKSVLIGRISNLNAPNNGQ